MLFKLLLIITISILSISNTYAVRATPYPVLLTQADGTQLTVLLKGDEFFNYKTTLDGYALVPDSKGILTYATQILSGALTSTNIKASDIGKRSGQEKQLLQTLTPNLSLTKQNQLGRAMRSRSSVSGSGPQKTYPLTGSPKSLVILVNFSDKSFVTSTPQIAFTNLLNQKNYSANSGTGSAKDYFRDNSMGVFDPQFDVVGPFTLPQTMDYYGKNDTNGDDTNPVQMVVDGCTLAFNSGVNFAQYDTDGDGIIDNVFIYYAGYNEAEGGPANSVWPHRWAIYPNSLYTNGNYSGTVASTTFNGKQIKGYACTSELKNSFGSSMCGIGTFTHEFGHVLGLEDMYVTGSTPDHYTLYSWDIMDYGPYLNGGRTPCGYSSYERFFMKWLVPIELKTPQIVTLDTLATSNKAYLISQYGNHNLSGSNPNPVEFFLLENRQNKGWDKYLGQNPSTNSQPGHGLLITHIYYNQSTWASNTPNDDPTAMGVDIVEADGIGSELTTSDDPFPGTSNVTSYSPFLRSGTNIGKSLTYIAETNGIMSFRFMGGGNIPSTSTAGTPTIFSTVCGTPSGYQTLTVNGSKLKSNIILSFGTGLHFEIKKETDLTWNKTITLSPTDSTVSNIKVQIRYNPTVPSYKNTHNETLNLTTPYATTVTVNLSGKSTRPVYVIPPVATAATDITLKSFVAHWNAVADSISKLAAGYYLTVYNTSNGSSETNQGFKNGLTAPEGWTINASAISTSTVYSGDSIPAIQFKNTGENIITEKYLLPASGLSLFIKSLSENSGKLLIEASNGNQWSTIENISITSSLSTTKTYTFDSSTNYSQFRFTFTKGSGYLIIDDISAKFSKQIEYNALNKWISANNETVYNDTLFNIIPGRDYYYKVKASDKTLDYDGSIKYENITDYSNTILLSLSTDSIIHFLNKNGSLHLYRDNSGTIILQILNTNSVIRIYNSIGQLVQTIVPKTLAIPINNLHTGQFYIIQAGSNCVKTIIQ